MKLIKYLTETQSTKMPPKQFKYFKELAAEFKFDNPGYKYITMNGFMKDLEKNDYKSLSVLFNDLKVESIQEFVEKYKDYIDRVNEDIDYGKDFNKPEDKARKAKLEKVIKVNNAKANYGHGSYSVSLIGDKWPSDSDLIWFCDYPGGAPFGGRVEGSRDKKLKTVSVHTD